MKQFSPYRDFSHVPEFKFQGFEHLRNMLKVHAFFPKYNYKDGVISGYDSEGNLHKIGVLEEI